MKFLEHWRGVAYAFMAILVTLLCVDILGVLGKGTPSVSSNSLDAQTWDAWRALDEKGAIFLEREYKSVVAEIRTRVEYEHTLFVLKFTLIGATLYLIFQKTGPRSAGLERTEITALVAWTAVTVAALIDLRLMANQSFVMTLGGWVRTYEGLRLGSSVLLGWEAYLADNLLSRRFYPALRISSQILTALLFCATAGIFLLQPYTSDRRAVLVSRIGALLSICLMTAASVSLRRTSNAPAMYVALGSSAAVLAVLLLLRPKEAK